MHYSLCGIGSEIRFDDIKLFTGVIFAITGRCSVNTRKVIVWPTYASFIYNRIKPKKLKSQVRL